MEKSSQDMSNPASAVPKNANKPSTQSSHKPPIRTCDNFVIEKCCSTLRKMKKACVEFCKEYKEYLEEVGEVDEVIKEVCAPNGAKEEAKDGKGRNDRRGGKRCNLKCTDTKDFTEFEISKITSKQCSEILDKWFIEKVENLKDPETINDSGLKAIERLMTFVSELGIKITKEGQETLQKQFKGKLEGLEATQKALKMDTIQIKKENKKGKGKKKHQKKKEFTIADCDAFGFFGLHKQFQMALKNKNNTDTLDIILAAVESFIFQTPTVQNQIVKMIEGSVRHIKIAQEILRRAEKKEINYYIICFEYMCSLTSSKAVETVYKNLKGEKSPYDIKQAREQFVLDTVNFYKELENEPENIRHAQKICYILLDMVYQSNYANNKEIEKFAENFWNTCCQGNVIKIANVFRNILEFLVKNKLRLFENEISYIGKEFVEGYLAKEIDKIPVEEKPVISEEAKCEHVEDHTSLIPKILIELEKIVKKKALKGPELIEIPEPASAEEVDKLLQELKSASDLSILEYHISQIYTQGQVQIQDYQNCAEIISSIQRSLRNDKYIVKNYGLATVENFGSSTNTLWSMDSDIDIAIEFAQKQQDKKQHGKKDKKANKGKPKEVSKVAQFKKIDYVQALCDVRRCVRGMALEGNIEGIFGARVPLIKFKHAKTGIECDISLNNTNGIPNSRLTRLYCEFDQRVHIMIVYLRKILKSAGLLQGDQGCLNSYSIILLVISFCQRQDPPILPNLQQSPSKKEEIIFHATTKNRYGRVNCKELKYNLNEDLAKLKEDFEGKNEKGVAELVIEFLAEYFLKPVDSQIDIKKGGHGSQDTDQYSFLDIVEPFTDDAKVGQGCRKDSHHPQAYQQFAFDFLNNVLENSG